MEGKSERDSDDSATLVGDDVTVVSNELVASESGVVSQLWQTLANVCQ